MKTLSQVFTFIWGLLIVCKYLFRKPVTIRYPEEKRKLPARSRGRHYLTKWEDGLERCVGCELCAIVCPSQAIYVKPAENKPGDVHSHGERYATISNQYAALHLLRLLRRSLPYRSDYLRKRI